MKIYQPPKPIRLRVPHIVQQESTDCLVACVSMCLAYQQRSFSRRRLIRTLRTQEEGTYFPNLDNLKRLGIRVYRHTDGSFDQLYKGLENDRPCIVAVQAAEFSHWDAHPCDHAVVVVGIDDHYVRINDPAFPIPALRIPINEFDLAWFEGRERYAVLISD